MDKIWAPWREKYITSIKEESAGSIFARINKEKKDKKNYIFLRSKHSFAVLNIYPYNNGHSLIVPNRQVRDLIELKREEREDLFDTLEETKILLEKVLKPAGFNVGINLGRVAGAGIPQHLHVHIVPRWKGDVNFMPVVGRTKVISQSLNAIYKKLVDENKRRNRRARR